MFVYAIKNTNETINVLIKIINVLLYIAMFAIAIWYVGTYGVIVIYGFGCAMAIYALNAIREYINNEKYINDRRNSEK